MKKIPSENNKPSLWYQLYFVLASLLGLVCIVIGLSVFTNNVLTTYYFKPKDQNYSMPPQPYIEVKTLRDSKQLTDEQKQALTNWENDYKRWQEEQQNYNYQDEERKRSFAFSISMLVTGIPIFALHAPVVFGWGKKREE